MEKYTRIEDWVAKSGELASVDIHVLLCLASYADKITGHNCYPSQSTLAEDLRLARCTVNRSIRVLEEKGFLFVERTRIGNRYKFLKGLVFCDVAPELHDSTRATPHVAPELHHHVAPELHNQEPLHQEPITNTKKETCSPFADPPISKIAEEKPPLAEPKSSKRPQPHPWQRQDLPAEFLEFGREEGYPDRQIYFQFNKFNDYWSDRPSVERPGWLASWRTWLRKTEPDTKRWGEVHADEALLEEEMASLQDFKVPVYQWPQRTQDYHRLRDARQKRQEAA